MLFFIFLLSAAFTFGCLRASILNRFFTRGPQREGVIVVSAVLFSTLAGWLIFNFSEARISSASLQFDGAYPLMLTGILYFLAALRRRADWPIWVTDFFVIAVAVASLFVARRSQLGASPETVSDSLIALGEGSTLLTVAWMWLIARMTAALNRTPQVTGGYIGLVALSLLILIQLDGRASALFATNAAAALAGGGLATLPFAVRRKDFNIGWSASLALGFLLAQIATAGLLKNAVFFILVLSLIVFGLPLLDVSFFRLRAAGRGEQINVEEQKLRLHEALLRRGVGQGKIAALFLVGGAALCALGVLMARFVAGGGAAAWVLAARALVLLALLFGVFIVIFSLARVWMRRGKDEIIPEDVEAFGVRISPVSMQEAIEKIEGFIQSQKPHHVVTSDANAILRAQEDEEYAGILRRAALITPDGFGVVWGARLMNLPVYERVTGVDMVTGICERAAAKGYSIYILGSEPGIAATAAEKLCERFPGLKVAGTQHGFWQKEGVSEEEIVARIRDAKPDVLFVAFGIPAQEKFIARHFEALNVPVSLGVGGSFDVYSEKLRRAPEAVQRSGMEWLYRVWQEPWRWKRMGYVPRFMAFALRTWLFGKRPAAPK